MLERSGGACSRRPPGSCSPSTRLSSATTWPRPRARSRPPRGTDRQARDPLLQPGRPHPARAGAGRLRRVRRAHPGPRLTDHEDPLRDTRDDGTDVRSCRPGLRPSSRHRLGRLLEDAYSPCCRRSRPRREAGARPRRPRGPAVGGQRAPGALPRHRRGRLRRGRLQPRCRGAERGLRHCPALRRGGPRRQPHPAAGPGTHLPGLAIGGFVIRSRAHAVRRVRESCSPSPRCAPSSMRSPAPSCPRSRGRRSHLRPRDRCSERFEVAIS